MACDADSVETLLVFSDKYYSLSHRQWLEWLCQLVINAAGTTVTAAINLAASNKMAALSDRNLEECRIAVFTAALFDAQHIINEIATQKYPSLDRHDLMCATIAAYCAAAGGSAQTVETLSVGNGYFKLSQRNDTLAIDAVICANNSVNCTNVTAVALSPGITGMSERHLKEVICAVINSSAAPPCATPTGLAAAWQVDTTTIVTWNAVPAGMDKTEVWSSSDNITFVLSATVNAPGVTTTLGASVTAPYVKIRFTINSPATNCPFTAAIQASSPPLNAQTVSWLARITANGGAAPSAGTISAINTFFNGMDSNSLTSLIITMAMFVPDNLIAAITPLIKSPSIFGTDPWTNTGFVGGDLGANGLTGGAGKYLYPGVVTDTSDMTLTSEMLCFYAYNTNTASPGADFGSTDGGTQHLFANNFNAFGLTCFADLFGQVTRISLATPGNGIYMASRIASNDNKLYFASSGSAWSAVGSNAVASSNLTHVGELLFAFNNNGSAIDYCNTTMSFAALGKGFTSGQGQTLFNLVQACRVALAGGFR